MEKRTALIWILVFSIAGTLFAGYLSVTKLLLGYCPLKEPCPLVFGLPACVYGLVMYLAILAISIILLSAGSYADARAKTKTRSQAKAGKGEGAGSKGLVDALFTVSFIGIVFAIYSAIEEIFYSACPGGCSYSLLIPTCIYGLVMYCAILAFTTRLMKKQPD